LQFLLILSVVLVKFELVIDGNSGEKTKIYSPIILDWGEDKSLYERFVEENMDEFKNEVDNLDTRLNTIGNECGLFEEYFDSKAGKYGQNLCKLKDRPKAKLRLYFIFYSYRAIILGGGGVKPKETRTHQEVQKLNDENSLLGLISETLQLAEKAGDFQIDENGDMISTTNFIYDTEKYANSKKKK
jgi:hypothetical protein